LSPPTLKDGTDVRYCCAVVAEVGMFGSAGMPSVFGHSRLFGWPTSPKRPASTVGVTTIQYYKEYKDKAFSQEV